MENKSKHLFKEMYFHWHLGSQLLFYQFFLTFLFCNGIAKITWQGENILFILTIVYPLNLLKKHLFSLLYKAD